MPWEIFSCKVLELVEWGTIWVPSKPLSLDRCWHRLHAAMLIATAFVVFLENQNQSASQHSYNWLWALRS
eukprot:4715972-Amphidinium_carterae.2